jgi:putative membrane protein
MVGDHGLSNGALAVLLNQLDLEPEDNEVSRMLKSEAERTLAALRALSGNEFDRKYIEGQIEGHQTVLNLLDRELIPSARRYALRTFLQFVREQVVGHLQHARYVLASMG